MALDIDIHKHIPGLTKEAAAKVHEEAHGLLAGGIYEVEEGK